MCPDQVPDPDRDALTLRADIFRFASAFSVPIAVATVGFLLTSSSGSTVVRGLLAVAAFVFAFCGAFCIFALSNAARTVSTGNYGLDGPARASLKTVYVSIAAGLSLLLLATTCHLIAPSRPANRTEELAVLIALLAETHGPRMAQGGFSVLSHRVGPFAEASHELGPELANDVQSLASAVSSELAPDEIRLVAIVGAADKRELSDYAATAYGTNVGLAQARATAVRDLFGGLLNVPTERRLALAAGPEHVGTMVGPESLAEDRYATIWILHTSK
ncbi:MAG: hypothetical protein ACQGVC_09165 [Myxococcota bacterium]